MELINNAINVSSIISFISNVLLYVSFAFIIGTLFTYLLPSDSYPKTVVPFWVVVSSTVVIPVATFIPIYTLTREMLDYFQMPFFELMFNIISSFQIGSSWLITIGLTIVLFFVWLLLSVNKNNETAKVILSMIGIIVVLIMLYAQGLASHPASMTEGGTGALAHTLHFTATSVWVGLLLVVGWFSNGREHWLTFLRWFTPTAVTCLIVIIFSGLLMTSYIAPEYVNALSLNYGQSLLIKHILIIPVLVFAFMNGFMIKKQLSNEQKKPQTWVKVESMFIIFIFAVTAFMSEQVPPHEVALTLQRTSPSPLFTWFFGTEVAAQLPLIVGVNIFTVLFIGLAILSLLTIVYLMSKRWSKTVVVSVCVMSILSVILFYLAIMVSVHGSV